MSDTSRKQRDLSKNVILFTISHFGPKILVFLLVPLYTSCLSTGDYGIADIVSTTVSLVLPLLLICIDSGVSRFTLDRSTDNVEVFTSTMNIQLKGTFIALVLSAVALLIPLPFNKLYVVFFLLMFVAHGFYSFGTAFCRGIDKIGIMIEMSLLNTGITCVLNILFLLVFEFGINGYMVANFLGTYVAVIWGYLRFKFWKYYSRKRTPKALTKEITKYCIPLIFNKIGWWINNSIDKYVVIGFINEEANGIYSVSYKIPTILSTVSGVFAEAWSLSAIKEFDPEDKDGFIKDMYNLYNSVLVICCAALVVLNIPIATLLYKNEFFVAWKYTGPLLLSVIFGAFSGFLGAICSAVKDTKIYTYSTIAGGLTNVALSIALVPFIGIMGVAIGTLVSNIVIWAIRLKRVRKHLKLRVNFLFHFAMYALIVVQFVIGLFFEFNLIAVAVQTVIFLVIALFNFKAIFKVFDMLKGLIARKSKK